MLFLLQCALVSVGLSGMVNHVYLVVDIALSMPLIIFIMLHYCHSNLF